MPRGSPARLLLSSPWGEVGGRGGARVAPRGADRTPPPQGRATGSRCTGPGPRRWLPRCSPGARRPPWASGARQRAPWGWWVRPWCRASTCSRATRPTRARARPSPTPWGARPPWRGPSTRAPPAQRAPLSGTSQTRRGGGSAATPWRSLAPSGPKRSRSSSVASRSGWPRPGRAGGRGGARLRRPRNHPPPPRRTGARRRAPRAPPGASACRFGGECRSP